MYILPMQPSWDFIRTFEAVAKTGSLSAAARELGLTQPTVGRHIDLLEQSLKVALFQRSREGMALTERGAELVSSAQEMRRASDGFARRAAGLDGDLSGVVRISANDVLGVLILPQLLARFMADNPAIEVELVVSNSAANLLQRDADIAIRMFRPVQNDLVARKLAELPLGFYAHDSYLAAHPAPRTLSDLASHRVIGMDRDPSMIQAAQAIGAPLSAGDFAFRCDNILTHIQAIRAGLGIGITHCGLAKPWRDVQPVLPDIALPQLELWIACHADVRYNRRVRLAMDFLATALRTPYAEVATG